MAEATGLDIEVDPEAVRRGATIRTIRKAYGWTLPALGQAVGKSHGYLSKIERGQKLAPVALCTDIAKALGVPAAAIISPGYPDDKAGV